MYAHSCFTYVVDHAHAFVVAVVSLHDVEVHLVERVAGQRLALLRRLVNAQLELGELRLAEHGALHALEIVAEEREARGRSP